MIIEKSEIPKHLLKYFQLKEKKTIIYKGYISHLCDIFDGVKRVLRKDGTCWVVLGDTYGNSGKGAGGYSDKSTLQGFTGEHTKGRRMAKESWNFRKKPAIEDKSFAKCLIQVPARFSIEMCNRGWILRNTLIWKKPNCMPSSIKDRFTVDFEYVFFFVKNKKYWFEQQFEAIKEETQGRYQYEYGQGKREKIRRKICGSPKGFKKINHRGRNKRCVWTITTKPFKEAHFAVFPEKLVVTPIESRCPKGGIVLDPFCGSGTTGVVAKKLNRKFIGIELSQEYCKIIKNRIKAITPNLL